ncbi:hypothetical protein ABNB59_17235 [Paenibacillus larvae]|uniref:Uncharacterized protein n=2 Tax=Paenibacillus larvae TaxID=1464 RepID=A0AAP5JWE6_9BACL|nr:hypothetical protein [Paenibacillus larvae]AQR77222.1 hypothetical protein BXP28_07450 [Paenibacillus larvae subsp. larvae]AVF21819.1 hypothetical protein ERICI_01956 [Paenibacillus larvae subsp. larvae]ETK27486.1 hypothetical protein ERIC1_1c09320 [Paenibacillus larvae subsp. larvae DSM 25719]MCY7489796.1 hypothetical protein [Paenibacillus larvae]MCY9564987.1 hypothetical protein [Paenibacillus larvae]
MKIEVTHHAVEKAVTSLRINRKIANEWVRSNVKKARYIADIIAEDGTPSRLFAGGGVLFILAQDNDIVITLYPGDNPINIIRQKVESVTQKELRKVERKERRHQREAKIAKLELAVERAACLLRAEKTRSQSVKLAMAARVAAIDQYIEQLDHDLAEVQAEKRRVAKAVAAYMI